MSRADLPADEVTRAAQWLADIARWPDEPADLLVHRFALKYWQARKAVDRARKPQPRDRETPGSRNPETGRRPEAATPRPGDRVVNLADRRNRDQEQERAFHEYVELAKKAQQSLVLSDAIAAGKAWSRFVYLFCGEQTT